MTANDQYPLTTLFPSTPYLLAYALPLFLLSVVLTFAGTFLTLDRTRSFAPHYDAIPGAYERPKKFRFVLQGGAGGLIIGYLFGCKYVRFRSWICWLTYPPSASINIPCPPRTGRIELCSTYVQVVRCRLAALRHHYHCTLRKMEVLRALICRNFRRVRYFLVLPVL